MEESKEKAPTEISSVKTTKASVDKVYAIACGVNLEINNGQLLLNKKSISDNDESEDVQSKAEKNLRKIYVDWLRNQPTYNIVVLSGAGSSYGFGDGSFKGTGLNGLWDQIIDADGEILKKLIDLCEFDETTKDLEKLLTKAQRLLEIKTNEDLKRYIEKIEAHIFEMCSLKFSNPFLSPHFQFLNKITKRKVSLPRVKLFTLNYDTLFEQAATEGRFTVIDGFTFTNTRIFNGQVYDYDIVLRTGSRLKNEDNFVKKVFHLYKLHGSIDWLSINNQVVQKENIEQKTISDGGAKRVMIFPRDSKFELSYEQPYFELIGRLQKTLRTENTFLITIGFSFNDKHIRSIILEALKQNPSLHLLAINHPNIVEDDELKSFASLDNRIMLIAEKFEDFSNYYPDNNSFNTADPLELIVELLADKMNIKKQDDEV
jgi:hypothetical protein